MMCDDTLLVDPLGPDPLVCLPGRKRLKLLNDALALSGAVAEAPVGVETGKVYARPPGGVVTAPLPLAMLIFLEDGPEPIFGAERFALLDDDHYSQAMVRAAQDEGRAGQFALRARVAGQVRMARLVRPRSPEGFAASVRLAADRIAAEGKD